MSAEIEMSGNSHQHKAGENFSPGAAERIFRRVLVFFEWVARLITLSVVVSTSYGVFMRYVVNSPIRWVEEVTGYLVIGLVVLGAPMVLLENSHIEVDLLTGSLKGKALKIVRLWAMLAVVMVCSALIWSGWRATKLSYLFNMHGEGYIEAPLWIPQGLMSCGFVLLMIAAVVRIFSLLSKEKK